MIPVLPGLALKLVLAQCERRGWLPSQKYQRDIALALRTKDFDTALKAYRRLQARKRTEAVADARELIQMSVDSSRMALARIRAEHERQRERLGQELAQLKQQQQQADREHARLTEQLQAAWWTVSGLKVRLRRRYPQLDSDGWLARHIQRREELLRLRTETSSKQRELTAALAELEQELAAAAEGVSVLASIEKQL